MTVTPFRIAVPDDELAALRAAIARTRWPDQVDGAGWDYGTELGYLQELVGFWADGFDWRARERVLNSLPQFRAEVDAPGFDGFGVHFVHQPGVGPAPLPLVLTHGWPSTHYEYHDVVGRLADPGAYGGDPADAFHVVVPSLPGYGFSDIPRSPGMTPRVIAAMWVALMRRARVRAVRGCGLRLGRVRDRAARARPPGRARRHPHGHAQLPRRRARASGPRTKPTTRHAPRRGGARRPATARSRAPGRSPSRTGSWTPPPGWPDGSSRSGGAGPTATATSSPCSPRDELLTTIAIYWFTGTINSANRLYYESRTHPIRLVEGERVQPPAGFLLERVIEGPGANIGPPPRIRADEVYDVRRWTVADRGAHFPAMENPDLYVEEVRAFFRPLRPEGRHRI